MLMTKEQGNAGAQVAEATEAAGGAGLSVDDVVRKMVAAEATPAAEEAVEADGAGEVAEDGKADAAGAEAGADEAAAGEQEPDEHGARFSPEQQAIFEREIGKKVAKFKAVEDELRGEIETLRSQLETRPATQPETRGGAPDLMALNAGQLDALEQQAQDLADWCEEHAEGYEADPDKKDDQSLTAEQIRKAKVNQHRLLREIPKVREMQKAVAAAETVAVSEYPELRRGGKDRTMYENFCRVVPGFRNLPNGLMILGDMIAGERARKAKAEAAAAGTRKPAPVARPLPGAGGAKKPSVAAAGGRQPGYTAAQMVKDGGTVEAATRLLLEREKRQ